MKFTRTLKKGMSGADVLYIKQHLFALGVYDKRITRITSPVFRADTVEAVERYDRTHKDIDGVQLAADGGEIDRKTWDAIERDFNALPKSVPLPKKDYPDILSTKLTAISKDLAGHTAARIAVVKAALKFATDPDMPGDFPKSFYRRGGNIYNTDLSVNTMTKAALATYFRIKKYEEYYDDGRKGMMLAASEASNYTCTGADCSGGVVGIWRLLKEVKAGFDDTANSLCSKNHSVVRAKADRKPGDLIWKSGHVGIYVGADMVVEWAGGAYGCQLSNATGKRRVFNYVTRKIDEKAKWTSYHDPIYY